MAFLQMPRAPGRDEGVLSWARQIHDVVRSLLPFDGPGIRVNRQFNGTTYSGDATAAGAAPAADYPWKAFPSRYLGTPPDPNAEDRALRFRLIDGNVNSQTPSNMNDEFVAYGDLTDTGITYDDAVITYVYWQASIYETATGQGDFTMDRPEIKTIEGQVGDSLTDLVSPPDFGSDGAFPAYIIGQICIVQNYGGALHFPPGLNAYLGVVPVVSGTLDGSLTRVFQYTT